MASPLGIRWVSACASSARSGSLLLVKQVVQDSVAGKIGLRGGDRIGIADGQKLVVGGDILLAVQGIKLVSNEDMVRALKSLGDPSARPGSTGDDPPRRENPGAQHEVDRTVIRGPS